MYYSNRDVRRLDKAIKIAGDSDCRQKHGAMVMRAGRVLAIHPNRMRNNPYIVSDPHTNSSIHAEVRALKQVEDARGTTIYVARLTASGPALSKPCINCETALRAAGVKRVVYTTDAGIGVDEY